MVYCNFGPDCDVYMYYGINGFTFTARMSDNTLDCFNVPDIGMAIYKFRKFQGAGLKVPRSVIDRLFMEHKELMREIA